MFVLSKKDGFHVGYTFTRFNTNSTELEYSLWTEKGELKANMTIEVLEKLKQRIEDQKL